LEDILAALSSASLGSAPNLHFVSSLSDVDYNNRIFRLNHLVYGLFDHPWKKRQLQEMVVVGRTKI
jgi:hypothetical protein